jgi:hypothetical protein
MFFGNGCYGASGLALIVPPKDVADKKTHSGTRWRGKSHLSSTLVLVSNPTSNLPIIPRHYPRRIALVAPTMPKFVAITVRIGSGDSLKQASGCKVELRLTTLT